MAVAGGKGFHCHSIEAHRLRGLDPILLGFRLALAQLETAMRPVAPLPHEVSHLIIIPHLISMDRRQALTSALEFGTPKQGKHSSPLTGLESPYR